MRYIKSDRQRTLRSLRVFALAATLVLGTAACGSSSSDDEASSKLPTLNVGYTTGGSAIKWFVAQEQGFFTKRGLKVKPIGFEGGVQAAAAMKSGSVDINLTVATGVATALTTGVDVKTFYADYDEARGDWLVSSKKNTVQSVSDLPGKTLATFKGTSPWVCMQAMLEKEGMTDKVDFKDIKPAAWGPTITKSDADAVFAFPPQAQKLVASGGTKVLPCSDYIDETVIWIGPAETLKKKKASIVAWLGGMDEAATWIKSHKEEAIDIWAKYSGVSRDDAAAAIDYLDFLPAEDLLDPSNQFNLVNADGLAKQFAAYRKILDSGKIFPEALPDLASSIDPEYVQTYVDENK